jgi:4-hydroxy-2-oxoheptanedioate aldolase
MQKNLTKEKLKNGLPVFGAIIHEYSPGAVELFGAIGYDFVMIDCEHGSMSVDQVENMVRGAEVFGITPIARIPNHEDSTILRFLDRGVQGIIIPHVNTRAQAEAVAKAARYHPEGHRGIGGGRSHDYGVNISRDESMKFVNENILVIPMIEEVEAVSNVEEICSVKGVDVLHVAPGDLGQSMGNASQAEIREVMDRVVPKIRAAGKWVGVGGNSPNDINRVSDLIVTGANLITIASHGLMKSGAESFRKSVEDQLRESSLND